MKIDKIIKTDPDKRYRSVLATSTLKGDAVRNSAGDNLGKIEEIMIDVPKGSIAYAVLSFGGFLGIRDKLFAIPWSLLRVDEDQRCCVLDVEKSVLESAPGFDKDNWPDMGDTKWASAVLAYYHVEPDWEDTVRKVYRSGGGGL